VLTLLLLSLLLLLPLLLRFFQGTGAKSQLEFMPLINVCAVSADTEGLAGQGRAWRVKGIGLVLTGP
jgi:hypothetical protein